MCQKTLSSKERRAKEEESSKKYDVIGRVQNTWWSNHTKRLNTLDGLVKTQL
jgi:hypothetical protein